MGWEPTYNMQLFVLTCHWTVARIYVGWGSTWFQYAIVLTWDVWRILPDKPLSLYYVVLRCDGTWCGCGNMYCPCTVSFWDATVLDVDLTVYVRMEVLCTLLPGYDNSETVLVPFMFFESSVYVLLPFRQTLSPAPGRGLLLKDRWQPDVANAKCTG